MRLLLIILKHFSNEKIIMKIRRGKPRLFCLMTFSFSYMGCKFNIKGPAFTGPFYYAGICGWGLS